MKLTQRKPLVLAVTVLAVMLVAPSGMLGQDAEPGSESIGELRRQAEQGPAAAQFALGFDYHQGSLARRARASDRLAARASAPVSRRRARSRGGPRPGRLAPKRRTRSA